MKFQFKTQFFDGKEELDYLIDINSHILNHELHFSIQQQGEYAKLILEFQNNYGISFDYHFHLIDILTNIAKCKRNGGLSSIYYMQLQSTFIKFLHECVFRYDAKQFYKYVNNNVVLFNEIQQSLILRNYDDPKARYGISLGWHVLILQKSLEHKYGKEVELIKFSSENKMQCCFTWKFLNEKLIDDIILPIGILSSQRPNVIHCTSKIAIDLYPLYSTEIKIRIVDALKKHFESKKKPRIIITKVYSVSSFTYFEVQYTIPTEEDPDATPDISFDLNSEFKILM